MSTINFLLLWLLLTFIQLSENKKCEEATSSDPNVELDSIHIFTKIRYRYGVTKVFCKMHNKNNYDSGEAKFNLNIAPEAFVTNFTMEIDGQIYMSHILERLEAKKKYNKALRNDAAGGLLSYAPEENNFEISINLHANGTVLFYLEYEEEIPLIPDHGNGKYQYKVNIPTKVKSVKHFCVDVDILEIKEITPTPVNLCNNYDNCLEMDLKQDTFLLKREGGRGVRIIWEPSIVPGKLEELIDKGVLGSYNVNYKFVQNNETINEIVIRNGYFVHRFSPRNLPPVPVHVLFVLDISESMISSSRMEQMTKAMTKILGDLKSHDYFNIITFSSEAKNWIPLAPEIPLEYNCSGTAYPADFYYKEMAKEYIKGLKFEGNTNIYVALLTALELAKGFKRNNPLHCQKMFSFPSPMIFFLTDGSPTSGIVDEEILLEKVREYNENLSVPIFSLAFGFDAHHTLLEALSFQNNGISRIIFDSANASAQLQDFYSLVSSPVLTNITFTYASGLMKPKLSSSFELIRIERDMEVAIVGELKNFHELSLENSSSTFVNANGLALASYEFTTNVCLCGQCTSENKQQNGTGLGIMADVLCRNDPYKEDLFLERFWVYKRIKELIKDKEINVSLIQELAIKYNFVTPYTSLLIIVPEDDKLSDNRKRYNSYTTLGEMILRDKDKNGTSLLKVLSPKRSNSSIKNWKNYSVGRNQSDRMRIETHVQTLREELDSLISDQNEIVKEIKDIPKKLSLEDITWLNTTGFNLTLLSSSGKVQSFQILKSFREQKSFPDCRINGARVTKGKCMHLMKCVQSEFLNDLNLFVQSYFCPLSSRIGNFVGVCCPN